MAAIPQEPRQKMINMMYLVLTAMLALNVSSEILNAFKTVNNSLEKSNVVVDASTATIMASLKQKTTEPSTAEKANIWYPKAQNVQSFSSAVFNYIKGLKDQILTKSGGNPNDPTKRYKEDNLDIPTRMMVDKGQGKKLLQMLTEYKKNVLGVDPAIAAEFTKSLPIDLDKPKTQNKSNKTWESAYFHMVPTVAALTILSKFQNDVKTSENKIVAFCHEQVGKVIIRSDAFAALALANANYIMPGQEIEITAGVGGFSTKAQPVISINGSNVPIDADGTAKMKITGGGLGSHSIPVHIVYTDQDNKKVSIDKTVEYTVGQSAASIALDKMNVLYIGVDNPVSISATAGGSEKLQVSISNGSITPTGGGHFIARVNTVSDDCRVNVSVDGKPAGTAIFRVRTIPRPVATIGAFESGDNINAGAIRVQAGVGAYIKDFPFDLKYSVVSFTLTADNADGDIEEAPCTGNLWSPKALNMIKNLQAGRTVTVDNIHAVGPDGRNQKLPSLVYYIK